MLPRAVICPLLLVAGLLGPALSVSGQQSQPTPAKPAIPTRTDTVIVTADITRMDVEAPDPAVKVFASEDLMDANPGRPGAPISIPGYPVETASSGIKAPQYFAPGVAGDHGEPIAQYLQVGSFLLPNNLSANAHGNGYADPNLFIAHAIESVQVDGGAFNVREGNHALNLAAIYGLRSHLEPFLTLTTDNRDLTATAGLSPSARSWLAAEFSYGNGFLDRLEHRRQLKLNYGAAWQLRQHAITLVGIGYLGYGYLAGLQPICGFNAIDAAAGWRTLPDTIDPRQRDQTHTALVAINDNWRPAPTRQIQLSAFFRSYNLSLSSDFGLGLIRQSEFRTVGGASAAWLDDLSRSFTLMAGLDYQREAPRRVNLDHYNFFDPARPALYGPFHRIAGNDVTIAPISPYLAGQGTLGAHLRYYLGWRHDQISIQNRDRLIPANSFTRWAGVDSPKATLTLTPGPNRKLPQLSASFGKSYFTEDPRIGLATNPALRPQAIETARSYQLVVSEALHSTDLKLTVGHETQTAEYGKIDADQGLQTNQGPGRILFLAATLRQRFPAGSFQATWEQADARLTREPTATITPEAPRQIADISATWQKLPFRLQSKAEFEFVGKKVLGTGCDSTLPDGGAAYCVGKPNTEFRFAFARSFVSERLSIGLQGLAAQGWTGQTTENFASASVYAPGAVGLGPDGLVKADPVAEAVGVRIPSYLSLTLNWHIGRGAAR